MKIARLGLAAAVLAGSFAIAAPDEASAMPVAAATVPATASADASVQEARLICGPYRCFRRFGYRRPIIRRFYGWRRPFYRRPFVRRFY